MKGIARWLVLGGLMGYVGVASALSWDDPFGLKDAAAAAGKQAAEELVAGLDISTRNLRDMSNQFGGLVADLYGSNPERAAAARRIFTGLLGRNLADKEIPAFEVSVAFDVRPGDSLPAGTKLDVDLWFSADNNDESVRAKFKSANSSFIPHPINGALSVPSTNETLANQVVAAARLYATGGGPSTTMRGGWGVPPGAISVRDLECYKQAGIDINSRSNSVEYSQKVAFEGCIKTKDAEALAHVVLTLLEAKSVTGDTLNYTRLVPGGLYVAVLAEKRQLAALAGKRLQVWVHEQGHQDKVLEAFKGGRFVFSIDDMLKNTVDSKSSIYGELCWAWASLRFEPWLVTAPERGGPVQQRN